MKRAGAAAVVLAVCISAGWLLAGAASRPVLGVGAAVPSLAFASTRGETLVLRATPGKPLFVMLFDSRCGHCTNQFDRLDPSIERLAGIEVYLLTAEGSVDLDWIGGRWSHLAQSGDVTWGTVNGDDFARHFGTTLTPALFLFDRAGRLTGRWIGETKLEALLVTDVE